jgi:Domain of unknown function (DUF4845)
LPHERGKRVGRRQAMKAATARGALRRTGKAQRGVTLFGLMFWALLVGFVAYLVIRIFPTVNEYLTIQSSVEKIARGNPTTVAEARLAFDKQKDIEYSISSISGKDLIVTKENDKVVVSYAYDKLVPIWGPVYILIKYEGRSR